MSVFISCYIGGKAIYSCYYSYIIQSRSYIGLQPTNAAVFAANAIANFKLVA
ncbi:hypothetical protein OKW96_15955 [Sphingobacterium sp. KU25419]|nr:hypothetical protein OKW96_15955 [Sphingobacterium sp. KU25419]